MSERVELDRLADYAAGLLDGTPDAVEVAHLIAADGAWAEAYTELLAADRRMRDDLLTLGAAPEPMPVDVAARLHAVLDDALHGRERANRPTVVSLAAVRRRRRAWTALAAAAAGVVAFAAFGLPALRTTVTGGGLGYRTSAEPMRGEAQRGEADSGKADSGKADAPAAPSAADLVVWASGIDYRRDMLRAGDEPTAASQPGAAVPHTPYDTAGKAFALDAQIPIELRRLVDPAARGACLAAVTATYGGRPVNVDYARFEGTPAIVVRMVDAGSKPSGIVVAGPACGQSGSGADVRYTVTAG